MLLKITSTVSIIFQEDGDEENPFGDEVGKNVTSFKEIPWVPKKKPKFFSRFLSRYSKNETFGSFYYCSFCQSPKMLNFSWDLSI